MKKIKLIVVGESLVGKTCIINQLISYTFNTDHIMSIGVDKQFKEIKLENETFILEI